MLRPLYILLTVLLLASCTKESEIPTSVNMTEYYPLQVGKFITYRLDSTVFINLNTQKVVRTYVVRDQVDAVVKDNLGNDAYRIRRMVRSSLDTTQWSDNATFLVVPSLQKTEFVENNLRFIKLINPVREGTAWQGNSYINTIDEFLRFYENWEYFYEKVGEPFTVNAKIFPETVTVNHVDEVDGNPNDKRFFYQIRKSSEVYAKGIGLIYKDFLHEYWQPSTNSFQTNSYGIKLTLLNHNF